MTLQEQVIYALRVLALESTERLKIITETHRKLQEEAARYGYRIDENGDLIEMKK
jgi:hypothetical protein